jgi:DHA1 family inner membrane transport protein
MMLGTPFWIFGIPALGALGLAVGLWGLGFAAANTMQQAQLVRVAPSLATASVALNTSAIYLGQAFGALVGAGLVANGSGESVGYSVAAFLLATLLITELPRLELTKGSAKL